MSLSDALKIVLSFLLGAVSSGLVTLWVMRHQERVRIDDRRVKLANEIIEVCQDILKAVFDDDLAEMKNQTTKLVLVEGRIQAAYGGAHERFCTWLSGLIAVADKAAWKASKDKESVPSEGQILLGGVVDDIRRGVQKWINNRKEWTEDDYFAEEDHDEADVSIRIASAEFRQSVDVSLPKWSADVKGKALATALALATADPEETELDDRISRSVSELGIERLAKALGVLICVFMARLEPASGQPDRLHLIVPAVLTRLQRSGYSSYVEIAALAGVLVVATMGEDPYAWRRRLSPISADELSTWGQTAWLLKDLIDHVFGHHAVADIIRLIQRG